MYPSDSCNSAMKSLLCQCWPEVLLLMGGSVFICLIQFLLEEFNNDLSKRLNEVVNEIRRQRCSYLRYFFFLFQDFDLNGCFIFFFTSYTHSSPVQ
jgi:hypothetical protein